MQKPVIFVVDRNPIHRNLVKYHLELQNFAIVQSFPSGDECLYRLRKSAQPDYLVTGVSTGDYDGFDFLSLVLGIAPAVRVICFDTFEDSEMAEKFISAGACDYISKTRYPETGIAELVKNLRYLVTAKAMAAERR